MGNSQSKTYNRACIVTKDDVFEAIKNCEKVGWSWSGSLSGVHHTAIVLFLDGEPRFTVNWTPKNGTKVGSTLFETRGQLVFEDERKKSKDNISYKDVIQEMSVNREIHIDGTFSLKLTKFLDNLMSFEFTAYENRDEDGNAEFYDLSICNCRDHVLSVMKRMHDNYEVESIPSSMDGVKSVRKWWAEDMMYKFTATKAAISLPPYYLKIHFDTLRHGRVQAWDTDMDRYIARLHRQLDTINYIYSHI